MEKYKKTIIRLGLSAMLFAAALFLPETPWRLLLFVPAYLIIGYDVLCKAGRNILHGQVFDENFLMCLATVGAFVLGEYSEAVAVMLFYQVGELFQSYAVNRSRASIESLMALCPDRATLLDGDEEREVDPFEIEAGQCILVRPGERIALDGTVESGSALLDTSALTGEPTPRRISPGDSVLSGCTVLDSVLTVRVTKPFEESTASKILDMVQNAGNKKARTENFITRFAKVYTPAVVVCAAALCVLPPLFTGDAFSVWLARALTFLVISCPCALVISVPLAFFGGIGAASKIGVLVKGSNYLDALSKLEIAVFDKTGTLTKGEFTVTEIHAEGCKESELLRLAAHAEARSGHPIARSVLAAYGEEPDRSIVSDIAEIAGKGVSAIVSGQKILAGSAQLMRENGLEPAQAPESGTAVYISADGNYKGFLLISDTVKPDAERCMLELKRLGTAKTVMLTGDRRAGAKQVAARLHMDEVHAELLPLDKVSCVETLLAQKHGGTLAFVGDGMNDAPVLSRADIGVAMGALGSDAAIDAADIVLMHDTPSSLPSAVRIARKTVRIAKENIVFALAVKLAVLVLGALGLAGMWQAVFADVGVAVIAILNSMRMLLVRKHVSEKAV